MGIKIIRALVTGICFLFLSCQLFPTVKSANIVIFLGVSSYSMRIPVWPIAEALAERGDNVTFISPFTSKTPNPKIRDYAPTKLKEWIETWEKSDFFGNVFEERKKGAGIMNYLMFPDIGITLAEKLYNDEEYLNWVKSAKVDLVILDGMTNEVGYGMAHYWGAKVVMFQSCGLLGYHTTSWGLPDETASIPSTEFSNPTD